MTLLHCVALEAETKNPRLLDLPQELETVIKCKSLSIEQLQTDINRLTNAINKLKKQVSKVDFMLTRCSINILSNVYGYYAIFQLHFLGNFNGKYVRIGDFHNTYWFLWMI